MTDFLSALRSYLLAQKAITDLCERRVYAMALPADEIKYMPRKAVVLVASGGEFRGSRVTGRPRIDAVCYGETDFDAAKMERPVAQALKELQRETYNGVLLHNATVADGPFQARDPETFWPAMRRQAIIRVDEREVG